MRQGREKQSGMMTSNDVDVKRTKVIILTRLEGKNFIVYSVYSGIDPAKASELWRRLPFTRRRRHKHAAWCRVYIVSRDYRQDVFRVTCGRTGVGSIAYIDVMIDGADGWIVSWIKIANGLEAFVTSGVNHVIDEYSTERLYRLTP